MALRRPIPQPCPEGWRVNFRHQGNRIRRVFSREKYTDPFAAAVAYVGDVFGGRTTTGPPVAQVVADYLQWAERTGKKRATTITADRRRLATFSAWCEESRIASLSDIDVNHIRRFQTWFLDNYPLYKDGRQLKAPSTKERDRRRLATWDKYRLAVSALFRWAIEREIVKDNPTRRPEFRQRITKRIDQIRVFSTEEINGVLEYFAGEPDVQLFFRLMVNTGLRLGEAINLRWGDINLSQRVISVRESKSGRARSVPIRKALLPHLCGGKPAEPVFRPRSWYRRLQTALEDLGYPPGRVHDLRHTFGANLAMAGVPLPVIQELLGHAEITTTMIYVHFAPIHLRDAVEKLPFD